MTNIPLSSLLHKQLNEGLKKLLAKKNKYTIQQLVDAIRDYNNTAGNNGKKGILSDYDKVITNVLSEPYVKSTIKIEIGSILSTRDKKIKEFVQNSNILTKENGKQVYPYISETYEIISKESFLSHLQDYKIVINIAKEINSKMQVFTKNKEKKITYDFDKYIQKHLGISGIEGHEEQKEIPNQYMYDSINENIQHEIASYIVHNVFPHIYDTTTEKIIKNLEVKKEFAHAIQSHLNAGIRGYTENKSIYESSGNPKKEYQYGEIIDGFSEQEELSRDLATLLSKRAQAIIEENHLQEYQNTSQLIDYLSPAYFSLNSLLEKYNIRRAY